MDIKKLDMKNLVIQIVNVIVMITIQKAIKYSYYKDGIVYSFMKIKVYRAVKLIQIIEENQIL